MEVKGAEIYEKPQNELVWPTLCSKITIFLAKIAKFWKIPQKSTVCTNLCWLHCWKVLLHGSKLGKLCKNAFLYQFGVDSVVLANFRPKKSNAAAQKVRAKKLWQKVITIGISVVCLPKTEVRFSSSLICRFYNFAKSRENFKILQ